MARGDKVWVDLTAVVGIDMSGGDSSGGASNPMELDVSNGIGVDLVEYPV